MVKEHYKITHLMADGTRLSDITGYIIPDSSPVYDIFKKINEDYWEVQK
ncbi:BOW99_gp33 family protein [Streptococcus gordonii]|jgi:hypothetical protein|nr:hypothetical protein [Streptococcus gordonii]QBX16276.1 hypothetical protein Javan241_0005 [Streptococcus phage Javan241]